MNEAILEKLEARLDRRTFLRGSALAAAALVAATLVGPVALYSDHVLDAAEAGPHRPARQDLVVEITPGVVRWFAQHDDPIPTVLGEPHRVYELVGKVPVYAAALPEARTRAEPKIDTVGRRQDSEAFFDPSTTPEQRHAILERRHVDEVLLDLRDQAAVARVLVGDPLLEQVYRDERFVILRVKR